jgi:hypothetical protein
VGRELSAPLLDLLTIRLRHAAELDLDHGPRLLLREAVAELERVTGGVRIRGASRTSRTACASPAAVETAS